jgi:prepilin-type N-terminal cleavage/methylation domain-containing protein
MINKFNSEKGLTLIEVIAASAILVIMLVGFFTFFNQGARFTEINDDSVKASNLARDVLASLKSNPPTFTFSDETSIECLPPFTTFNEEGPDIESVHKKGFLDSNGDGTANTSDDLKLHLTVCEETETDLIKVKVEIFEVVNTTEESITETYGYLEVR